MTDLDTRDGLSDDIAYLRAVHPKPTWSGHANFGELTRFWLHVHDALRGEAADVSLVIAQLIEGRLDASRFARLFVPRINQFLGHLNAHHQIEDQAYFPKFKGLDDRMQAGFAVLEADHGLIHESLQATVDTARALLDALESDAQEAAAVAFEDAFTLLRARLTRHLADEEDLVVPALLEHGERSVG